MALEVIFGILIPRIAVVISPSLRLLVPFRLFECLTFEGAPALMIVRTVIEDANEVNI